MKKYNSKFLSNAAPVIMSIVLVLSTTCSCGTVAPKISDVEIKSFRLTPAIENKPDIFLYSISLNTDIDSSVIVEVDGSEYTSSAEISHSFLIPSATAILSYSISAIDGEGNETRNSGSSSFHENESCKMFSYVGDLSEYLDRFSPIISDIGRNLVSHCDKLNVVLFGGINYDNIFNKQLVFSLSENTSKQVFDVVKARFQEFEIELRNNWPILSDDELMVVFILNIVGHLWHYGNYPGPLERASGCVQENEFVSAEEAEWVYGYYGQYGEIPLYARDPSGMSDYLKSRIGCCTDHGFFIQALLDEAGITSKRLTIPGHWVNEVLIDDKWYTIDATAGVLIDQSVKNMVNKEGRTTFLFFNPYMDKENTDFFANRLYPDFPAYTMGLGLSWESPPSRIYYEPLWERELAQMAGDY